MQIFGTSDILNIKYQYLRSSPVELTFKLLNVKLDYTSQNLGRSHGPQAVVTHPRGSGWDPMIDSTLHPPPHIALKLRSSPWLGICFSLSFFKTTLFIANNQKKNLCQKRWRYKISSEFKSLDVSIRHGRNQMFKSFNQYSTFYFPQRCFLLWWFYSQVSSLCVHPHLPSKSQASQIQVK